MVEQLPFIELQRCKDRTQMTYDEGSTSRRSSPTSAACWFPRGT